VLLPTVVIQCSGSGAECAGELCWRETRDGADAAGAKELREGDQQVNGKDEVFSHQANRTITAGTCKTARRVRIASHCEFAAHRRQIAEVTGFR